jgi:hypothetical protein
MADDKKTGILKNGIQLIVCLFAAFGGFLLNIAPPQGGGVKLSVGIAQFIALALMLYLSAFSVYSLVLNKKRYKKNYRAWLMICGIALVLTLVSSLGYFQQYDHLVLKVENWDTTFVRGRLSPESLKICREDKLGDGDQCEHELLRNFYTAEQVSAGMLWTNASVRSSKMKLLIWYLSFIIMLSLTLFSAIELLSSNFLGKESKPGAT